MVQTSIESWVQLMLYVYARIENDAENPDFITGNQFARIGILENPKAFI